ncbi:MAG TPA: hypothetical protein VK527_09260, partial [Candidatus Limnocylindrales bacterium]|nr:hypothetical protein [Candidatus Limnocylindrales bacterium]
MQSTIKQLKRWIGSAGIVSLALLAAHPATATICFTSGKVYIQQKVYDKAAAFLECARKGEPENVDALSLLAFARAQQREYISAGAAFQIGIDVAKKKGDSKHAQDLERNRLAVNAQLFNAGISALNRAGTIEVQSERSAGDASSPQAKAEKEMGPPFEYVRFSEKSGTHEFWYYPQASVTLYFAPGADEPRKIPYVPYEGLGDLQKAVIDT